MACVAGKGAVYVWGRNDDFRLGLKKYEGERSGGDLGALKERRRKENLIVGIEEKKLIFTVVSQQCEANR